MPYRFTLPIYWTGTETALTAEELRQDRNSAWIFLANKFISIVPVVGNIFTSKYRDRQTWANTVDSDQSPWNTAFD